MKETNNHSGGLSESFIFSIIHDWKNQMASIISRTEMLQMPNLSEKRRQYLVQQLYGNCNMMMDALNKMVEICRYRSGIVNSNAIPFNVRLAVAEIMDVYEEAFQHKQLSATNEIMDDYSVFADRDSISLTLSNLIGNAIKFTPRGGKIRVFAEKTTDDGIRIVIQDNGIGIDEKRMADVIENNNYFTTPGTIGETGTGFGILLCVSQLKYCGSKLEFANNPDGGARFSFVLKTKKPEKQT